MSDRTFLDWPFFEAYHREVAEWADAWCAENPVENHEDVDSACRRIVRSLGQSPMLGMVNPYHAIGYQLAASSVE